MGTDHARLILGVDGGGTKTLAVLAELGADGKVMPLGCGQSGAANVRLNGRGAALRNLGTAIGAALARRGDPGRGIDCAVLALAGIGGTDDKDLVARWLQGRERVDRIEVVHDTQPVLEIGTPEGWGVVLVVGTGSVAIGRDRAGRRLMRGGWGPWFGDLGSGYDLGRRALAAVAGMEDELAPPTALAGAVLGHFGLSDARLVTRVLAGCGDPRREIAALAPTVLESAAGGDAVALAILERGANELARLVIGAASGLGLERGYPLALTGGVICGSPTYRDMLESRLREQAPAPGPATLVRTPVTGCLAIARRLLGGAGAPRAPGARNADLLQMAVFDCPAG